jgi:hypothetical protein
MFVGWNLYEQICPNPQPHKPAKDKKHNREKKGGGEWKEKKSTTWHLPTSCMHLIKPVTLGLQRVKGGEKNQSKGE